MQKHAGFPAVPAFYGRDTCFRQYLRVEACILMEELSQTYGKLCTEYYVDSFNVNRKMRSLKRKIVRDLLRIKQRTDQIDAILKQYSFNG